MNARATVLLLRTLAIAWVGGWTGNALGVPAGWLSGAMIAVSVVAVAGVRIHVPVRLADAVFVVLGTLLGTGVTPEVVERAGAWPVSLAGLLISVVGMTVAVQVYLVRVARWDRTTAFFASVPGALSYIVAIAATSAADLRRVVVGQSVRLFLLVALVPALISSVEPLSAPVIRPVMPPPQLILLFVATTAGAAVFAALRLPAGLLSGSLAVSAGAHVAGWVTGGLPPELTVAAYVVLGSIIGLRFVGTDVTFLRRIAVASVGAFLIATGVAALCALGVSTVVHEPLGQILVAFAPGGLDAMTALALALHMDSAFVAAHQLVRFIAIAIAAPIAARFVVAREDETGKPEGA